MRRATKTQYNVLFSNKPSKFAQLSKLLAKKRISARSIVSAHNGNQAMIQFVAHKDAALRKKLESTDVEVREDQIFEFEIPNHPWELHKLVSTLARAHINIISLYGTVDGDNLRMVLAVDQPANAIDLIARLGYSPDYSVL